MRAQARAIAIATTGAEAAAACLLLALSAAGTDVPAVPQASSARHRAHRASLFALICPRTAASTASRAIFDSAAEADCGCGDGRAAAGAAKTDAIGCCSVGKRPVRVQSTAALARPAAASIASPGPTTRALAAVGYTRRNSCPAHQPAGVGPATAARLK